MVENKRIQPISDILNWKKDIDPDLLAWIRKASGIRSGTPVTNEESGDEEKHRVDSQTEEVQIDG